MPSIVITELVALDGVRICGEFHRTAEAATARSLSVPDFVTSHCAFSGDKLVAIALQSIRSNPAATLTVNFLDDVDDVEATYTLHGNQVLVFDIPESPVNPFAGIQIAAIQAVNSAPSDVADFEIIALFNASG